MTQKRPREKEEVIFYASIRRGATRRLNTSAIRVACVLSAILFICAPVFAMEYTASYYTRESCIAEGTSGICANGEVMQNERLTAASWFYPFGTRLKVSSMDSPGKAVIVTITDRGPSKRLVKKGRVIDLSVAAFSKLSPLRAGVIRVEIEELHK